MKNLDVMWMCDLCVWLMATSVSCIFILRHSAVKDASIEAGGLFIYTSLWSHPTDKTCTSEMNVPVLSGSVWVLAVFSASARLLKSTSGALQLVWDRRDDSPPGLGQMVRSLRQMLTTRAHSLSFWPAVMHSNTVRGPGLARCGAHLTTIPYLAPAVMPVMLLSWDCSPGTGLPWVM